DRMVQLQDPLVRTSHEVLWDRPPSVGLKDHKSHIRAQDKLNVGMLVCIVEIRKLNKNSLLIDVSYRSISSLNTLRKSEITHEYFPEEEVPGLSFSDSANHHYSMESTNAIL
ncbi:hypothetical protein J6590_049514, partial [Homalodisca vitripennis]